MERVMKVLVIVLLISIVGCSNSMENNQENVQNEPPITADASFTGTIKEINGNRALVLGKLGGGEGDVFVDLSVNSDETFRVGDRIKVGFDGTVMESNPAQINTLSVKLLD